MMVESRYEAPIHTLQITVPHREAEMLESWIREALRLEPVAIRKPGGSEIRLEIYFEDPSEALLARSVLMDRSGVDSVEHRCLEPRAWEMVYRDNFHRHPVGTQLEICPVWESDAPRGARTRILIDPGLSFGTGEHFTTTFCLEMIDEVWLNSPPASFLDVGTGSGLLSIAAAKLGCPRVVAVEVDADVLPYTRRNAALNGVEDRLEIICQDIRNEVATGPFDVVCANLYGGLLLECAEALLRLSAHRLILSGIRNCESGPVEGKFKNLGGTIVTRKDDGEWCGLLIGCAPRLQGAVA
jgi:ribosomal protein L11 methyltransferase